MGRLALQSRLLLIFGELTLSQVTPDSPTQSLGGGEATPGLWLKHGIQNREEVAWKPREEKSQYEAFIGL